MVATRRLVLSVGFVVSIMLGASAVHATPVTFSTSGIFTCSGCAGSGTNSVTFLDSPGALMITFTGLGTTSLNTPTGTSFGNFQTFVSGTGATASGTFTLNVTQTVPTAGSDAFTATYSGLFSASNSGSGTVDFTTTSVTIGGITYSLNSNAWGLVPPGTNNGITSVTGQILDAETPTTPVPEPGTLVLLGAGLACAATFSRRRRARG